MKALFTILSITISCASLNAQTIKHPTEDFLDRMSRKPDDSLMEIVAPVNRTGGKEIFLTYTSYTDAKQGYIWSIYAPIEGGYKLLEDGISFRLDHLYIGESKELGGLGLLTYTPSGGGKGTIRGFIFQDDSVKEVDIADVQLNEKNKNLYQKYFVGDKHPKVEIIPANKLPPR